MEKVVMTKVELDFESCGVTAWAVTESDDCEDGAIYFGTYEDAKNAALIICRKTGAFLQVIAY